MVAFLIILGNCTGLIEGTLIKKYNSKHSHGGFVFTALVSLFSMLYFVFINSGGFEFSYELILYGIAGGFLYCAASYFTYMALKEGSFAITMLVISYSIIFSIIYGLVFLSEQATYYTYIGFLLIFISLFLVKNNDEDKGVNFSAKWLIYTVLSTVSAGMYGVVQRIQQIRFDDQVTNEFMIIALGLSFIILFLIGLSKDGKYMKEILKYGGLYATFSGISNGITNMTSLVINTLMPISIASPVKTGTKTVFSFLVSLIIFREKFTARQIAGVLLSGIALIFLNM